MFGHVIADFDINKVRFEEIYYTERYSLINGESVFQPVVKTAIAYFTVPEEWLCRTYENVQFATLTVEYPVNDPSYAAEHSVVMISPTKLYKGAYEDYDWFPVRLKSSEIEALIALTNRTKRNREDG